MANDFGKLHMSKKILGLLALLIFAIQSDADNRRLWGLWKQINPDIEDATFEMELREDGTARIIREKKGPFMVITIIDGTYTTPENKTLSVKVAKTVIRFNKTEIVTPNIPNISATFRIVDNNLFWGTMILKKKESRPRRPNWR